MGDQRRSYRIATPGTLAVCRAARFANRYEVTNLSIGGALIRGGPALPVGETIDLRMFPAGRMSIETRARIVWQTGSREAGPAMGIAFENLDAFAEDMIHDMVTESLAFEAIA